MDPVEYGGGYQAPGGFQSGSSFIELGKSGHQSGANSVSAMSSSFQVEAMVETAAYFVQHDGTKVCVSHFTGNCEEGVRTFNGIRVHHEMSVIGDQTQARILQTLITLADRLYTPEEGEGLEKSRPYLAMVFRNAGAEDIVSEHSQRISRSYQVSICPLEKMSQVDEQVAVLFFVNVRLDSRLTRLMYVSDTAQIDRPTVVIPDAPAHVPKWGVLSTPFGVTTGSGIALSGVDVAAKTLQRSLQPGAVATGWTDASTSTVVHVAAENLTRNITLNGQVFPLTFRSVAAINGQRSRSHVVVATLNLGNVYIGDTAELGGRLLLDGHGRFVPLEPIIAGSDTKANAVAQVTANLDDLVADGYVSAAEEKEVIAAGTHHVYRAGLPARYAINPMRILDWVRTWYSAIDFTAGQAR